MGVSVAIQADPVSWVLEIIVIAILIRWLRWERKTEENGSNKVKVEIPTVVQVTPEPETEA
jgi:hypothetical protein